MKQPASLKLKTAPVAGQRITRKTLFGEGGGPGTRYAVYQVQTRHEPEWFVDDAENLDWLGMPSVIRQSASFDEAVSGL